MPFPLLSDVQGTVCREYGVLVKKNRSGKPEMGINRSTFIIDPKGKIAKIYKKVDVDHHAREVMKDINLLSE